jgi:tellurite methyltransferase
MMSNESEPFWERTYKAGSSPDTFGGGKPSKEVVEIAKMLPRRAKVLDLGCGEGRNALYLAQHGFETWGVDISKAGIEKFRRIAESLSVPVHAEVCDMRDYSFPTAFDLIVCLGCLHLIKREDWRSLIIEMKRNTADGGYHQIGVFTDVIPPPDDLREFMVGLFHEGELFDQYRDWTILNKESRIFEDEHPGSPKHKHANNRISARKPLVSGLAP